MDDDCIDSNGEISYTKKKSDSADNVPVSVSEEEETQMESEDEEKDSKAAPAPTIEGEEPCVSPTVDEEDNDNEEDNDDDTDKSDDNDDDDNEEGIFDFDLNDVEGMSEYELMRLQKIRRNESKLTSLGLIGGMMSTKYFTRFRDDILQRAKLTCFEELTVFHLLSFMGKKGYENGIGAMSAEERTAAGEKGYENGLGAKSAEERTAAGQNEYENGIGAMSAEAWTAARKKGSSNDKMGIAWEKKYVELKRCVEMPEIGTPLYTWQKGQLSNTHDSCLNAKIRKEIAENEGITIWSERRVKLSDLVVQKNRAKIGNAWEKKYAEFKSYDGMPKRGTPQLNWQRNQLGNGPGSLNAKIQEEKAENEESTIWSEWRVKLADCVEQKRRE